METDLIYIKDETWRKESSWRSQMCEHSGKTIWWWNTAMKGVSSKIKGSEGDNDGRGMSQMWIETRTRWLTHDNYLMLKLAGKIN